MKALTNINARSLADAVAAASAAAARGQAFAFSGGGTDLIQQIKDGTNQADVLINLRTVREARAVVVSPTETLIGGLITLSELAEHAALTGPWAVLREATASVGTPQIRNTATLAGNITQRPWCWYYRTGFPCFKAGGSHCFSEHGEHQQHAIFGGGPSFSVHPSDLAPALVALGATFEVLGPDGPRHLTAAELFVLPSQNPARENTLGATDLLTGVRIPTPAVDTVSTYLKITDRAAWTHAEVSVAAVLQVEGTRIQTASVVLGGVAPMPWRLPEVEQWLRGQALSATVAGQAGALATAQAQPLAKNGHKVPMTSAAVERALLRLVR
ncbi:MAG TPA: FAD binding domain-containing protein [Candidatus Saccharimonadia bacterium]|nr:FAD binding domain-containing protein [Candidatus Saccharimonadia bacterium]